MLEIFTPIKLPSVALLGHFTDQVADFHTLSYTSTIAKVEWLGNPLLYMFFLAFLELPVRNV